MNQLRVNARKLLRDYGRRPEYPLIDAQSIHDKFSCRVTAQIRACNLIPGLMQVPIPFDTYQGIETFTWASIDEVARKDFSGPVYSLQVEKHEHYIADGIITHNCIYGWKDGASHLWASNRKQTTILEFDRPSRSKEHPTMKPVLLFDYQIQNNTKARDIVLDLFLGSGTCLIACEQNDRTCYGSELEAGRRL